jgi:putative acetyltransferase
MLIRTEQECDHANVRALNEAAFPSAAEAGLVDALREQASPIISLVMENDETISGHIMFSPVSVKGVDTPLMMGLAPMAVAPAFQGTGIGSQLVQAGLEKCRRIGAVAVVVLGHPGYYPRFGFQPSTVFALKSEYDVPADVFMAQELVPGALQEISGTIQYHPAFAGL